MNEKRCRKCDTVKPASEFHRKRDSRDGLSGWCKTCNRAQSLRWKRENPERAEANLERWRAANPEKIRESDRRYRAKTAERQRELAKEHRERYPEKNQARKAVYVAVKSGRLVRPSFCGRCGAPEEKFADSRSSIEAHHDDYSKPLDVTWLCHACHIEHHTDRGADRDGKEVFAHGS